MDTPLLGGTEQPEDDKPVNGGIFFVRQTHLGFCPGDVILHLRPKAMVLLNEATPVAEYAYSNLVMWTQSNSSVTILLQNNMKRVLLTARGRRNAKKIVLMLHSITAKLEQALRSKLDLWGMTSSDLHSRSDSDDEIESQDMFQSQDGEAEDLETLRLFTVEQTHLPEHPTVVMFRIDKEGIGLLDRITGAELWTCSWYEIVMWRGDHAAVVIVFSASNKQLELLCDQSMSIVDAMTRKAHAVRLSRATDFIQRTSAVASATVSMQKQIEIPAAQLEYRKNLIEFKPAKVTYHAKWQDNGKLAAVRRMVPFAGAGGDSLTESLMAREQLKAIFALADTDGSGSLDVREIGELLQSLGIASESGRALGAVELEGMMIDMDAFGNEVNFDGFVQWAVGSTEGAHASELLKKRIEHQKKEVQASKFATSVAANSYCLTPSFVGCRRGAV